MQIKTSYFYQIRNFTPNLIPVSVCLSDPVWFRPPKGKEYYIDRRGIVCGLRYEPLIVQNQGTPEEYRSLLDTVDFDRLIKAFTFCSEKFKRPFGDPEPIIVLMVYETPDNPFSERSALQDYFSCHNWSCEELKYPINNNY